MEGKIPTGEYLLGLLVKLFAEQEGLEIDYEVIRGDEVITACNSNQKLVHGVN